jgi:hypothetical protein
MFYGPALSDPAYRIKVGESIAKLLLEDGNLGF